MRVSQPFGRRDEAVGLVEDVGADGECSGSK
jgi:hypothetical protein